MVRRREFVKAGAALAAGDAGSERPGADVPTALERGYDVGPGPRVAERLDQGPFGIEQDEGWYTIEATTPSDAPVRNLGLGLVGLHVGGERPRARGPRAAASRSSARSRSWRAAVRGRALHPLRLARRAEPARPPRPAPGLRAHARRGPPPRPRCRPCASSCRTPSTSRAQLALPDFLRDAVPLVTIRSRAAPGPRPRRAALRPPRVPAGLPRAERAAGRGVRRRPARRVRGPDDVRLLGRGAHGRLPEPVPRLPRRAERTFVEMTRLQLEAWKRAPLAVNTQPDISARRQPRGAGPARCARAAGCARTA